MHPLLYVVALLPLLYLIPVTFILIRNIKDLGPLYMEKNQARPIQNKDETPHIAVCIPARNEADVIGRNIEHLLQQTYSNFSIWILDDQSTDKTAQIVESFRRKHPERIHLIKGKPLPEAWLGKNWACHQLSRQSRGEWILFIDADVWLQPEALSSMTRQIRRYQLDALTVWPKQHLHSFAEKLLIPLMYYALLSVLPSIYVYRAPRWLPKKLQQKFAPLFSAACGQFIAFRREAYNKIGGHEAVRGEVVEDVALASKIKKSGFIIRMFQGNLSVHCRMYSSEREIRDGFRKNFLAGFAYNLPLFLTSAFLHLIVYVVPFLLLPYSLVCVNSLMLTGFLSSVILLIFLHRFMLATWFNWNLWSVLLHPIAVLWYQYLGLVALWDYFSRNTVSWKGRKV